MQNSISIKEYKCFKDVLIFNSLKRVNLLIGRNNSGKSSVLDIVDSLTNNSEHHALPEIILTTTIKKKFFSNNPIKTIVTTTKRRLMTTQEKEDQEKKEFISSAQDYIGFKLNWTLTENEYSGIKELDANTRNIIKDNAKLENLYNSPFREHFVNEIPLYLSNKFFKRVSAERDIIPEASNNNSYKIKANGSGLTNAVTAYKNISNLSKKSNYIIKRKLLPAINEVFEKDGDFIDIDCQQLENLEWEIFLEEKNKTFIPISQSGSGLKTIVIVLCFLILIPEIEGKPLNETFARSSFLLATFHYQAYFSKISLFRPF